jgi:tetratricopeptide (TPR) repeat protein
MQKKSMKCTYVYYFKVKRLQNIKSYYFFIFELLMFTFASILVLLLSMSQLLVFLSFFLPFSTPDYEKAEKFYQQGKYEQAQVLFEKIVKDNPSDYKSIEYLGDIAGHYKKWDKAISYYEKLKKQFPKNAEYHYKYGGALGMKAKEINKFKALSLIDEVEQSFLNAAKLDTKHIATRWALVMFYIELPGIVGGSEKKALKYANELMSLSKVDGHLSQGHIDEYFKRYTKAEVSYLKAHQLGNTKTTFQKLYNLYLNKLKDKLKATKLKEQFDNK